MAHSVDPFFHQEKHLEESVPGLCGLCYGYAAIFLLREVKAQVFEEGNP